MKHYYFIGSCFAENVGRRLQERLGAEQVAVNPFGALYNPASVGQHLRMLLHGESPQPLVFTSADGVRACWACGHKYSRTLGEVNADFSVALQEAFRVAAARLKAADVVLITWSTDHAYSLNKSSLLAPHSSLLDEPVANCHKMPARCFEERVLQVEETLTQWRTLLAEMAEKQIVFTLSPYRYAKHGMHESNLSKARLMLQIDALCQEFPNAHYFPAYEIVIDELRDYRYYDADGLHPSQEAADIVYERFLQYDL